ncbi:MAG: hypothetical protein M1819_001384 [Sarea resinae]|nr:MAG: hypothetical protein M1819_001384 [Sarea resinae]
MEATPEPSVVDYARFHGLSTNHLTLHPLQSASMPPTSGDFWVSFADPEDMPSADETHWEMPLTERLAASREAAILLSVVRETPEEAPLSELLAKEFREKKWESGNQAETMKLELPLLRTEHSTDMPSFGRRIVPDLEHLGIPGIMLDGEQDEGFCWPARSLELPKTIEGNLRNEKLQAPRDLLLYLQARLKDPLQEADESVMEEGALGYQKRAFLEPLTPPLLPLSPAPTPFVPVSPDTQLLLLSDSTSPTASQSRELDSQLMREDADDMLLDTDEVMALFDQGGSEGEQLPSSPPKIRERRRRPSDLKIETPLTPPQTTQHPAFTGPSHQKQTLPHLLDSLVPSLPPPLPSTPSGASSLSPTAAFINAQIQPLALQATRRVKQEQLLESDATIHRVSIPLMDFSLPLPPWKVYTCRLNSKVKYREAHSELLSQCKLLNALKSRCFTERDLGWPGAARLERSLPWAPFGPELGDVAVNENFGRGNEKAVEDILESLTLINDKDIDVGVIGGKKGSGLSILTSGLDGDEDDDSILPGTAKLQTDMDSLLLRRKRKIQVDGDGSYAFPRAETALNLSSSSMTFSLLGGIFSTATALDNFLELRGSSTITPIAKKQKILTQSPYFASTTTVPATKKPAAGENAQSPRFSMPAAASDIDGTQSTVIPIPIPCPSPSPSSEPLRAPFVIATTLLSHRSLYRLLQTLHPSATFIERDFSAHLSTTSSNNFGVPSPQENGRFDNRRPPNNSNSNQDHHHIPSLLSLGDEADLILSPHTALIITTLQKLQQRPLPGHEHLPSRGNVCVQERIRRIGTRYERLLVLVSEGALASFNGISGTGSGSGGIPNTANNLAQRDVDALAGLTSFCNSLAANTEVVSLYAAGGEEELARWISGLMARYGCLCTSWEIFLRRSGLNAYAAQVVLASLKPSSTSPSPLPSTLPPAIPPPYRRCSPPSQDQEHGQEREHNRPSYPALASFVLMSAPERERRLSGAVGGTRVLRRVGSVLDACWG